MEESITAAMVNYLNSIRIGDNLTISSLWAVTLSVIPQLTSPIFSIVNVTAGFEHDTHSSEDLNVLFNEVTRGKSENVQIVFV